jgi:hypothetical protein
LKGNDIGSARASRRKTAIHKGGFHSMSESRCFGHATRRYDIVDNHVYNNFIRKIIKRKTLIFSYVSPPGNQIGADPPQTGGSAAQAAGRIAALNVKVRSV